ncbi:hypothetical protein BH23CHL2_BH23CHL2_25620 [soil metagenome]
MVETHEIREGARVAGSHGERFGVVDGIRTDSVSGEPKSFVVKTGFWPFQKRKMLSVDVVRQINNDPNTIIVDVSKQVFRGIPEIQE